MSNCFEIVRKFKNRMVFILTLFSLIITSLPAFAQVPVGKIIVQVNGFENNEGKARLLLFSQKEKKAFPMDKDKALKKIVVPIKNKQVQFILENLPYDDYAISVHHDEDGNGKVKSNMFKIPKEGLGASNDAKGFMGPPSFDKAKVTLNKEEISITINIVN